MGKNDFSENEFLKKMEMEEFQESVQDLIDNNSSNVKAYNINKTNELSYNGNNLDDQSPKDYQEFLLKYYKTLSEIYPTLDSKNKIDYFLSSLVDNLTSKNAFYKSWVVTFDDYGTCTSVAKSNIDDRINKVFNFIGSDNLPNCSKKIFKNKEKILSGSSIEICSRCPAKLACGNNLLLNRLESKDRVLGTLIVSLPDEIILSKDELVSWGNLIDHVTKRLIKIEKKFATLVDEKYNVESYLKEKEIIKPLQLGIASLKDEQIISSNDDFCKLTGFTIDELLYKNISFLFLNSNEYKRVKKQLFNFSKKNFGSSVATQFRNKNGRIINIHLTAQVKDQFEANPQLILTAMDLTYKRDTNITLKRFKNALDFSNDGIIFVNTEDQKIIDYNKTFVSLSGYSQGEVEHLNLTKIFPLFSEVEIKEIIGNSSDNQKINRSYDTLFCKNDGIVIPVEIKVQQLSNDNYNTLVINILNKTELNLALRQVQKFTMAIEKVPVSVILTDKDGRIQYVNNHFLDLTGYAYSEVIGQNTTMINSGLNKEDLYLDLWNSITKGKKWSGEFINRKRDNTLYQERTTIYPVFNSSGKITNYLSISEDITDIKKIENQLEENIEKAQSSDKIKADFLAQMSHEIRTPINVLLSYSSMIRDEFEDIIDEEYKECFQMMSTAGERLIRTIDLMLNLSELQSGSYEKKIKKLDVYHDVIMPLYEEYEEITNNKNLKFSLRSLTNNYMVNVDNYSMRQIIVNLIDNAVKYTNQGSIEIKLWTNKLQNLVIDITDTGVGIKKEYLNDLFKPFSQEESGYTRSFEGNGLGLALVKKYCDLNNISISCSSEKGKGSKFTLVFN